MDEPGYGTTICPRCRVRGPVRLEGGQVCAACAAQEAWSRQEDEVLVVTHADVDAAVARHGRETAREPLARRLLAFAPAAASLILAALACLALSALFRPRPVGPIGPLFRSLRADAIAATVLGLVGFIVVVLGLRALRRGRHFRRAVLLVPHLGALLACTSVSIVAGLQLWGLAGGYGLAHDAMPARSAGPHPDPVVERVMQATVFLLAPDVDGDARGAGLGSGAVIATEPGRAWVVTCSHVAMPYAAVGSYRRADRAYPVWVELSDGRGSVGKVRWTAPPPLDVALVEVQVDGPLPPAVPLAEASDALETGAEVFFVPFPLRDGWLVHRGRVQRRESHLTPAGEYSLLFTDLPVQPGDSGSGLFDRQGRLVGLNTWTRMGAGAPQGISLPSEAMRAIARAVASGAIDKLDDSLPIERP
jgi:S1-C subfamily serine protease